MPVTQIRDVASRRSDPVWAAARDFWQLPDDELDQLLTLSRAADRVELKLTVPEAVHDATRAALGVDFARIPAYQVYYLDTEDRALYRHGVVHRVRSVKRRQDDSVIKLRPVSPGGIPEALRQSKQFVVEVDGMPGSYVCSGALKAHLGAHDVEQAIARRRPLHALFSKPQVRLLTGHLPPQVGIDELTILARWTRADASSCLTALTVLCSSSSGPSLMAPGSSSYPPVVRLMRPCGWPRGWLLSCARTTLTSQVPSRQRRALRSTSSTA
jgi:hypothetical protein